MNYQQPSKCPVCGNELTITRLSCPKCTSEINGSFSPCKYCALNDKMKLFLETFLKCRGSIKDVEKSLSISYPTVKALLDELLTTLYPAESIKRDEGPSAGEILDLLEKGEITAAEAADLLKRSE
jgi:hypothetical protein